MRARVFEYSAAVLLTGVGAVITITKIAETLGYILIGIGVLGILVTAFWNKIRLWIPIIRVEKRGKEKSLTEKYGWMEGLVQKQWHNPPDFVFPRIKRIIPSNSQNEIGVVVEWVNTSIFDLKFETLTGELAMGAVGSDPQSLGHQISLTKPPSLPPCQRCSCTFFIQISDEKMQQFREAVKNSIALSWKPYLTWELSTIGYSRTFSAQQYPPEEGVFIIVPSRY